MANPEKMMFPVGFDLEGGIIEAQKEWPALQKRLQKTLDGKPLTIKVTAKTTEQFETFSGKMRTSINDIRKNLASLEKQWNSMDKNQKFDKDGNLTKEAQEIVRKYNEMKVALDSYGQSLSQISNKIKKSANDEIKAQQKKEEAIRKTNSAYKAQSSYISRLIQRLGIYTSIYAVAGMLRDIRDTTAEFELQEVALGAIIQDAHEAQVLFSQIKAAAVESPYQIKELVDYTKQLAAYGFEQNKLFDTTMKLADISAGLGADMSRIILAVGQVSAATVLKGTELRQFTELGIPMVELLVEKFTQLRGEVVTTGEVFEMISDKAVSFKMVEEILNDLTSAGGMFYDMQRKQAETLAGQWSNMKDTIAIAYEEMGNTETLRNAMESVIGLVKSFADNWKSVFTAFAGMAGVVVATKLFNRLLQAAAINTEAVSIATKRHEIAQNELVVAQTKGGILAKMSAKINASVAASQLAAANATRLHARAWHTLNAAMKKNIFGLILAAIAAIVVAIVNATRKANELRNELDKIGSEGAVKMEQAVRNFERLAKIAVDSVDGTKRQTDALNELKRTYGDIIPSQDLQIEKLRAMNNEYNSLTEAIREKIAMQTLEQKVSTIQEDYGDKINEQQKKFKEYLEETAGLSSEEAIRVISNIQRQIAEGAITAGYEKGSIFKGEKGLRKAIAEEVFGKKDFDPLTGYKWDNYYGKIVKDLDESYKEFVLLNIGMEKAIQGVTDEMEASTGTLSKYTEAWEAANKEIETSIGKITDSKNTKLYEEKVEKAKVEEYVDFLGQTIGSEIEGFDMSKYVDGNEIDFSSLFNLEGLSVQARNAVRQVQTALQGLDGWKETLQSFAKDVTIDGITRKMSLYANEEIGNMGNLKDTLEDVAKKWKEFDAEVTRYGKTLEGTINPEEEKQLKNKKAQAEEYKRQAYAILEYYNSLDLLQEAKEKKDRTPLQILNEEVSLLEKVYAKYKELLKYMSSADAKAKTEEYFADTIGSLRFGAAFDTTKLKEILTKYQDAAKSLPESDKTVLELGFKVDDVSWQETLDDMKDRVAELADAVARSKEAKDFYDKMLGMTGDRQLSADLTMSVYGGVGDDLKENIKAQLEDAFEGVNIKPAFDGDKIDWSQLNDLVESIPIESKREEARKLVNEGIKDNARWLQDLYKTYEKFQTYEERRTAVMKREEELRKQIRENASLKPEEQEKQIAASRKREQAETLAIDIEEFKASKDWAKSFEEVENLATPTIERLMEKLKGFMDLNAAAFAENPDQLRTLMNEYQKLYDAIVERNPFTAISDGIKEYVEATQKLTSARQRLAEAAEGTQEYADAAKDLADAQDEQQKALAKTQKGFQAASSAISNLGNLMTELIDIFGIAEDSEFGAFIQDLVKWLGVMATVLGLVASIIAIIEAELAPLLAVAAAIAAVGAAISWLSDAKVRKANREIEKQEELLKRLSRSYEKLEKSAESTFGTEYLDNYRERLKLLQAEAEAYAKQIEAEQSKGKDKDDEAIDDYEEARQETLDKLDETQKEIAERMLGTDLGSAARSFAQAWLEAYKEFGNTSDAIGKKFEEMIDNMLVESAIAGVMKTALEPVFDLMKGMDIYDEDWIKNFNDTVAKAKENALVGSELVANALEQGGILSREMGENLSGISKDIATASEESILGLTAGINTQNFYISQIHAAVLRMEMLMQNGAGGGVNIQDLVTIQNQHLAHLPNISANTASTLQECRAILVQVTAIAENLGRVVTVNGTSHALRATLS